MAKPIVLIPHLFRLASTINFRKDYSPPSSPPSRLYARAVMQPHCCVIVEPPSLHHASICWCARGRGFPCLPAMRVALREPARSRAMAPYVAAATRVLLRVGLGQPHCLPPRRHRLSSPHVRYRSHRRRPLVLLAGCARNAWEEKHK